MTSAAPNQERPLLTLPIPGAWLTVGLLFVVGMLNYIDRLMLITMRLSIKEVIPMTDAQFGLLTTVFLWSYACLTPLAGFIADRFNCSRLIGLALLGWSTTTWLTGHATSYHELMATRIVLAICEACYLPAAGTLIGKYHRDRTISLATGIHLTGVIGGASLGGVGGWLAQKHGWHFPFELLGLVGMGYAGVLLIFLRDPKQGASAVAAIANRPQSGLKFGETLAGLLGNRRFILALVFYGLVGIASWTFLGWMPAFLGEHFKLAEGKAGLIATGCLNGGSLIGYLIGGVWADRWGRANPAGRTWVGIIGLGLALPCVFVIATTNSLALVTAGLIAFGFCKSLPDANIIPIIFNFTDSRHRATALGLMYAAGTTVGGGLIYLGGALRDAHVNITSVFYAGMVGIVMSAALLWLIRPSSSNP